MPKPRIAYIDQVIHWVKDDFAFNPMAEIPNRIKYADGRPFNPMASPQESLKCCQTIIALIDELKPEKPIEDGLLYQMAFIIGTANLLIEDEVGDVEGWKAIVQWNDDRAILKRFDGKLTEEAYDNLVAKADFFSDVAEGISLKTTPAAIQAKIKKEYPDNSPSSYWQLQIVRMKRYERITDHGAAHLFIEEYKRLLTATQAIEKAGVPLGLDFGNKL